MATLTDYWHRLVNTTSGRQALTAPEEAVQESLRAAKAASLEVYRNRQSDLASYSDDDFADSMRKLVHAVYTRARDRINGSNEPDARGNPATIGLLPGHRYLPIVRMMARTLAVVFHTPPDAFLHRSGKRLDPSEPEAIQWERDKRDLQWGTTLQALDLATVVHRTVMLRTAFVRGKMRWIVVRPHRCYVLQDVYDPTSIDYAAAIHVELPQPTQSPVHAQPVLYESWFCRQESPQAQAQWATTITDENGRAYDSPLFPGVSDHANPYGCHPFTVWRDGSPREGEFWLHERESWWTEQRWLNLCLMDLARVLRVQSFGIPVLTNSEGGNTDPTISPDEPLCLMRDQTFNFATPVTNLDQLERAIDNALRRHAVAEDLPAETWTGAGATRNLGALKLLREPLERRRTERLEAYDTAMRQQWRVHRTVANYHQAHGAARTRYGDDLELVVQYAPLPEVVDPFQDIQVEQHLLATGQLTIPQKLATARRIDLAAATKEWRANLATNAELPAPVKVAPPATPDNGVQRPADVQA